MRIMLSYTNSLSINTLENTEGAIKNRNWQQDEEKQIKNTTQYVLDTTILKTQDEDKQSKNTTQYVLDTTILKTQDEDKQIKNTT